MNLENENPSQGSTSRREFLAGSAGWLAGALIISWDSGWLGPILANAAAATPSQFAPNPFIAISPQGAITLVCHRCEMGQGIRTSMAMLLADELEVPWASVRLLQGDGDAKYGDQNTDGSKSVSLNWTPLRSAAAAAREMLVQAAAARWGVPVESCVAREGRVFHAATKQSASYGELATAAAMLPVPAHPKLKPDSELKFVGFPRPSYDLHAICSGKAVYGADLDLENMVHASLERSPTVGGRLKSLDASAAMAVPGVIKVVPLAFSAQRKYCNDAVAVIATNTWAAMQGRKALKIEWNPRPGATTSEVRKAAENALDRPGKVFKKEGDFEAQEKSAARVIEARYHAAHLVHATMEPPACVARPTENGYEIWAPSQDPQDARAEAANAVGMSEKHVTLHVTMIGGGFGRKSQHDFVIEAATLAKELQRPVKVTWTREDEIKHGFYHPQGAQSLKATLDAGGKITGWRHRSAFTPIAPMFDPNADAPNAFEIAQGVTNLPYNLPNILCEGMLVPTDARVAWLRSVCNIFHAYSVNSFLDEIAHETNRDPVELRLSLLDPKHRFAEVIRRAAKEGGWGRKRPKGVGLGFASHFSFKSYVAVALEVEVHGKKLHVRRADCVIDAGKVVNPDSVKAQLEGSVSFGLSGALYGEITMKDGVVEQSNFDTYNLVRMPEAPEVHVHLIKSDADPTGVGEPGVPPIAPALCGAIFAATGKRIRDLPVLRHL